MIALLSAPFFGWIIGAASYPVALFVCAVLPAMGALLTPVGATIGSVRAQVRGKN
jgi:hypothetical protein